MVKIESFTLKWSIKQLCLNTFFKNVLFFIICILNSERMACWFIRKPVCFSINCEVSIYVCKFYINVKTRTQPFRCPIIEKSLSSKQPLFTVRNIIKFKLICSTIFYRVQNVLKLYIPMECTTVN